MSLQLHRSVALKRAAWVAVAILAVAGCEDDRASTFAPTGPLGFNVGLLPVPDRIPGGSATVSGGTTVTLGLSWLRALTSPAVYQVWGYSVDATGNDVWTPLAGSLSETRNIASCPSGPTCPAHDTVRDLTDKPVFVPATTVVAAAGAGTYAGSDSVRELVTGATMVLSVANGSAVNPATQHAIVVSIEPNGASTTTPSANRALFRRIQFGGSGALTLGNFGGVDVINTVSPRDFAWIPSGSGLSSFRGSEVSVRFTNLARPPMGYYYRVVVVDTVGNEFLVDSLRSDFSGVTSESRASLLDADANQFLPGVNFQLIKFSTARNCGATSGELNCPRAGLTALGVPDAQPFGAISTLSLLLEPKQASGAVLGHTVVLTATVPDPARK